MKTYFVLLTNGLIQFDNENEAIKEMDSNDYAISVSEVDIDVMNEAFRNDEIETYEPSDYAYCEDCEFKKTIATKQY